MILYDEAIGLLEQLAQEHVLPAELVDVAGSVGRVLVDNLYAPESLPAFCSSAMDGYLVRAPVQPSTLQVTGQVSAGAKPLEPGSDEAIEIMTGAPLNFTGHEGVVRIEDVMRTDDKIELKKSVDVADNIRMTGSDVEKGQSILCAGTRIAPRHLMLLAALGIKHVSVRRRARIAIISTGNELANGQIRNSTGPYLQASLKDAELLNLGICPDSVEIFNDLLNQALKWNADIVISTGAVSVGAFDFVKRALENRGAQTIFHQVAIRPGKPILCAQLGDAVFFGLPGNPMASAVGCEFFVKHYWREINREASPNKRYVKLKSSFKKPSNLMMFCLAKINGDDVELLDKQASYAMSSFAQANAWVILPEGELGSQDLLLIDLP